MLRTHLEVMKWKISNARDVHTLGDFESYDIFIRALKKSLQKDLNKFASWTKQCNVPLLGKEMIAVQWTLL